MEILDKTGQTPYWYFNEATAARYRIRSITVTAGLWRLQHGLPPNPENGLGSRNVERDDNKVSMNNDNVICNYGGHDGKFALGTYFKLGLVVELGLFDDLRLFEVPVTDVRSTLAVEHVFEGQLTVNFLNQWLEKG